MVVEATKMKGDGDLVLTGQLGDVMKESATLALSWIRSNSKKVRYNRIQGAEVALTPITSKISTPKNDSK